jgi:hypothetical protein
MKNKTLVNGVIGIDVTVVVNPGDPDPGPGPGPNIIWDPINPEDL